MELTSHATQNVTILELAGRLDANEAPDVSGWFDRSSSQIRHVVVDLGGVSFIDSAGLSALVKGLKLCRQAGGDLYLCGLQPTVAIIFELTRLDKAFSTYADQAAAVQAFTQ